MSDACGDSPFPFVVCLGASAGGLEALEAFFRALPDQPGVPIVVVVHLSPNFKSLMPELLSKHTAMQVQTAHDEQELQTDEVYIIPAGKNMALQGRRLVLQAQDRTPGHPLHLPIDLFLASLAQEFGPRSLAIIFSGTGSDGSRGVLAIKEAGGVVLAQQPESAKFDGMPRSALMTGVVDDTGNPEQLAKQVEYLAGQSSTKLFSATQDEDDEQDDPFEDNEQSLEAVLHRLRKDLQIDMSYLRRKMVSRRIRRRMIIQGRSSAESYLELLGSDPAETQRLGRDLLIGVTRFFRDEEAFETLRARVIPELLLSLPANQTVRVWVSACSTGNEVYSLVMLLLEAMRGSGVERELKVFATDVDEHALERASRGTYTVSEVLDVPMPLLSRYFDQNGDEYTVRTSLRDKVIFARHNLVVDPPVTKLHLVSCRNFLIYLEPEPRKKVLDSLLSALLPETGILFLGSAESPILPDSALTCIDARAKVYRRTSAPSRRPLYPPVVDALSPLRAVTSQRNRSADDTHRHTAAVMRQTLEVAFEAEGRSAALIDEQNRLVEIITDPLSIFRLPKGRPTDDLGRICSSGLTASISTGRHQIEKSGGRSDYLALGGGSKGEDVRVTLMPVQGPGERPLYLLILTVVEKAAEGQHLARISSTSADRVAALESELRQTKENLQATIEELQSSSEEQQSTNEELIASNEELQSTNQELLSVNEELYTVNSEYHKKNQELQMLTADLENLLDSIDVATLYLDGELRVRKYNSSIARVIPLKTGDIGRPIGDLTTQLDTDVVADIERVLVSERPLEREVRDRSKAWVLMRITPYVGPAARHSGVLVTFVDVTRIKNAEETARVMSERLIHSNRKLATQSEQLEDLFSIVAHDLKRPVLGLDGALNMLSSSLESNDIDSVQRHLALALRSNRALSAMLQDLTEVSKLRELEAPVEPVDLQPWLEMLLNPFIERAQTQGVKLAWSCDHGQYHFARIAAEAIITNLVENALVHGASSESPRVDTAVLVDNNRIRISVADNGRGIAPLHHERIFELFRRLSPDKEDGGSGIGLVAARRFAERADGTIRVESDVDRGAKFIAELPLEGDGDTRSPPVSRPILVVDDDAVDAKRVRILLDRFAVRWARTLEEATQQIDHQRFGLIILDLSLPDGHGLKLTSSIKGINRNTPIIILSGQLDGLMPGALDAAHISGAFSKDEIEAPAFRRAVEMALAS